jgi:hypothetical protein
MALTGQIREDAMNIIYVNWRAKVVLDNWRAAGRFPHHTDEELLNIVEDGTVLMALRKFRDPSNCREIC